MFTENSKMIQWFNNQSVFSRQPQCHRIVFDNLRKKQEASTIV